jgi:hypothetical protein
MAKTGTNKPIPPKSLLTFVLESFPDWITLSLRILDKTFKTKLAIYGIADMNPFFICISVYFIEINKICEFYIRILYRILKRLLKRLATV